MNDASNKPIIVKSKLKWIFEQQFPSILRSSIVKNLPSQALLHVFKQLSSFVLSEFLDPHPMILKLIPSCARGLCAYQGSTLCFVRFCRLTIFFLKLRWAFELNVQGICSVCELERWSWSHIITSCIPNERCGCCSIVVEMGLQIVQPLELMGER